VEKKNECLYCGTQLPEGQPFCINEPTKIINGNSMSRSLCFKDHITIMKLDATLSPDSEELRDFKVNGAQYAEWYKGLSAN